MSIYDRELALSEIESIYHEGGWVGINKLCNSRFITVCPNFTTGKFIVTTPTTVANSTIKVFDTLGNFVFIGGCNNSETEIDLSNNTKGLYFVQVTNGAQNWTEKVLIE